MSNRQARQARQTQEAEQPQTRAERMNARRGVTLTLPYSGDEVILRRAPLLSLLEHGQLPDSLTGIVVEMIDRSEGKTEATVAEVVEGKLGSLSKLDQYREMMRLYDATVKACGVDPCFVDEVTDPRTEVAVGDLDPQDKAFVFQWAQGGESDPAAFRAEQERALAAPPEGQDVQPTAVGAAGAGPDGDAAAGELGR